jgi:hypothetical protein
MASNYWLDQQLSWCISLHLDPGITPQAPSGYAWRQADLRDSGGTQVLSDGSGWGESAQKLDHGSVVGIGGCVVIGDVVVLLRSLED